MKMSRFSEAQMMGVGRRQPDGAGMEDLRRAHSFDQQIFCRQK